MKKYEAVFTSRFRAYAEKFLVAGAYELKHTRGKRLFRVSELKEHQTAALQAAKDGCLVYKIPDDGRAYKPFDVVVLRGVAASVVIRFPEGTVMIDISEFPFGRKSFDYEEACLYGAVLPIK